MEERKSLPAATLRGKQTPCGALVPVKNILKRAEFKIGRWVFPYAVVSMVYANLYSIWL